MNDTKHCNTRKKWDKNNPVIDLAIFLDDVDDNETNAILHANTSIITNNARIISKWRLKTRTNIYKTNKTKINKN